MTLSSSFFEHMSNGQLRTNGIEDGRLLAAMGAVARERFVPASFEKSAYVDEDLPLGHDRYMLEPLVLARLLEQARPGPDDQALVIAGGLGYSTAVLSHLVRSVVMVEEHADFAVEARGRLSGQGPAKIEVIHGPLVDGGPAYRPYDLIVIEGAVECVPPSLCGQLSEGGRLVALELLSIRAGSTSGLCRYLTMERHGPLYPARHEETAFVHCLPPFARPKPFRL